MVKASEFGSGRCKRIPLVIRLADKDDKKPITGQRYGGRLFQANQEGKERREGSDKTLGLGDGRRWRKKMINQNHVALRSCK